MTDHITIGDVAPRIQYSGDGVQTLFTYPFPIFTTDDIEVYLGDVLQASGYTVAGAGQSAGGTVTFAVAPADGAKVTLLRNLAIARTSDFQEGGAFRAKTINDELDRQTAFIQQVSERVDRALVASPTDAQTSLALPAVADRANRYLGFDADGLPTTGPGGPILPVAFPMVPVIQAADPPAAFALLKQPASESASGVAEIATQAETNAGTDDTRFVTPAKLTASAQVNNRALDNRLINPEFQYFTRQAAFTDTLRSDDTYGPDRWVVLTQSNPVTCRNGGSNGGISDNRINLIQANASSQRMGLVQIIEKCYSFDLRGRPVVFDGWARCATSINIRYAIVEWLGTADTVTSDIVNNWNSNNYTAGNFFIAGSTTVISIGSLSLSSNIWTRFLPISGTVSNSSANVLVVVWTENAVAQNVQLNLTGLGLYPGTVAPSHYVPRPTSLEEILCMRYAQKSFFWQDEPKQNAGHTLGAATFITPSGASGTCRYYHRFIVPMRATPTITTYNPNANNANWRDTTGGNDRAVTATADYTVGLILDAASCTASRTHYIHWMAESEL